MTVTIYHNPKCSTSRNVLGMIRDAGIEPHIIEYLKTPLDHQALADLLQRMQMPARAVIRDKEALYSELGLDNPALDDAALIAAIVEHPILLNRPIVVTDRGASMCRPADIVKELL